MSDSEISLTQPLANQERNRERQQALFRDSSPIERDVEPARKRPRFLGDGASDDDEDTETNARQRPRQRREDPHNLDNLFQGLDDLPDDDDRPPARVELKSTISAKQREQMLNGVLNNNDIDKPVDASNIDEAIDAGGKKKRAPRVKLDAERLLGAKGFPLLIEQAKKFKVGPKGSEMDDLKRMLAMYQLWAHQMFPRNNFEDTVSRVEKLCKSRIMTSALQSWRVEHKQGKKASVLNAKGRKDDSSDDDDGNVAKAGEKLTSTDAARSAPAASAPLIHKPAQNTEPDDDDIDRMIEEELQDDDEMAFMDQFEAEVVATEQAKTQSAAVAAAPHTAAASHVPRVDDDFDEVDMDFDAMAELDNLVAQELERKRALAANSGASSVSGPTKETIQDAAPAKDRAVNPQSTASGEFDDLCEGIDFDDDMDDVVADSQKIPAKSATATAPTSSREEEEEDLEYVDE